jgi:hypothetical protein
MNQSTFAFRLAVAATLALLAGSSPARAGKDFNPELVSPGDMFSFDVAAYNTSTMPTTAEYAVDPDDVAFGTTAMTTGLGGDAVSITSSETVGAMTTTDTFTVSTATNFAPVGQTIGASMLPITGLQFSIGIDATYGDPVNVVLPITSYSATGSTIYGTGTGTTVNLSPNTTVAGGGESYTMYENISDGGTTLNALRFHSFTYTITYDTLPVPEPSAMVLCGLGLIGCALWALRRAAASNTR